MKIIRNKFLKHLRSLTLPCIGCVRRCTGVAMSEANSLYALHKARLIFFLYRRIKLDRTSRSLEYFMCNYFDVFQFFKRQDSEIDDVKKNVAASWLMICINFPLFFNSRHTGSSWHTKDSEQPFQLWKHY